MLTSPSVHPVGFHPWLTMWLHPRATIQQIVDIDPRHGIVLLAILTGFAIGVGEWFSAVVGDADTFLESLPLAIAFGLVEGIGMVLLFCLVLRWITRRSGEAIPYSHLVAAGFWSELPRIAFVPLLVCLMVAVTLVPGMAASGPLLDSGVRICYFALQLWATVLWYGAMAQVMNCSVGTVFGRAIATGLILFLLFLPVLAIGLLIQGYGYD